MAELNEQRTILTGNLDQLKSINNSATIRWPKLKKKILTILAIIVILTICITLIIYYKVNNSSNNEKFKEKVLVPPNPTKPLPPSPSLLRRFKKAAVCVDNPYCAKIGRDILEKNGSAVDATLAALFCSGVTTMQSMGLGGGFLMTLYIKEENRAYTLNAREMAPLNSKNELYKSSKDTSKIGPLAVAVPGELKGYWIAHQRFGKLQWKDIIMPTVELCENGYNMSKHQYKTLFMNKIENDSNINEWFRHPNGTFKTMGSKIIPKKLCATLRLIAENGGEDFYTGELSKIFLEDIKKVGGIITADDLKNYTAEWREPIRVKLRNGDQLYSVPPPGSGILLGFIMNLLDGFNFSRKSLQDIPNTIKTYNRMIEAFKFAYAKRTELGDLNFVNISQLMKNLTSTTYANEIRKLIKDTSTSSNPKDYGAVYYSRENHGTAHISVLAENGDAVSVTSSINLYYGAGISGPETGIILNSVMDDFSFPFFDNYFGIPGSPNNAMKPGKRPLSSMSPSILIDKNGNVKLVIGSAGGSKITTAVASVIARILWFGNNIKEAVDAPRIHHQLYPMEIQYEYGNLQQVITGLNKLGHNTTRYTDAGSVICALLNIDGQIYANADYRKGGDVYGLD